MEKVSILYYLNLHDGPDAGEEFGRRFDRTKCEEI